MGDPKKRHKKYSRPRKLFDKTRIEEEKSLIKKYGLKNKKEIWKAETEINRIRGLAKNLIVASQEEQEKFFNHLIHLGLIRQGANIDDVLALTKEKLLERRLQTIIVKKNLSKSIKEARQLIVHRKIKVSGKVIDAPSYIVKADEENEINLIKKQKKKKESINLSPETVETEKSETEPENLGEEKK